jgi:hypothetical protein
MRDGVCWGAGTRKAGAYRTIGEALRAVEELATGSYASIAVAAGVYRERVTVPCGVELVGAADGLTAIEDPSPSPSPDSPSVRNPEALALPKSLRSRPGLDCSATFRCSLLSTTPPRLLGTARALAVSPSAPKWQELTATPLQDVCPTVPRRLRLPFSVQRTSTG